MPADSLADSGNVPDVDIPDCAFVWNCAHPDNVTTKAAINTIKNLLMIIS